MLILGLPLGFAPRVLGYWILRQPPLAGMFASNTVGSLILQQIVLVLVTLIPGLVLSGLIYADVAATVRGDSAKGRSIRDWFLPLLIGGVIGTIGVSAASAMLFIPGILLWLAWAMFGPLVVLQGKGVLESLRGSVDLTRGHRWSILSVALILWLSYVIVYYGVGIGLRAAWFGLTPEMRPWVAMVGWYGVGGLGGMSYVLMWRVAEALVFFELVRLKSGTPAQGLAAVFD